MKLNIPAAAWRKTALVLRVVSLLSLMLYMAACAGLPAWVTEAQQILPVAVSIITAILSLVAGLAGKTIDPAIATTVQAIVNDITVGLTDLESLVKQYELNPGTSLLQNIEAAAAVVLANLQKIMNDAQIVDVATQQKITAIAQLVVTELEAWISTLPLLSAPAGAHISFIVPSAVRELREAFDAVIKSPTGSPVVDAELAKIKTL